MPTAGFEHASPASERLQIYALDCAASRIYIVGLQKLNNVYNMTSLILPYFDRCSMSITPCLESVTHNKGHYVYTRPLQLRTCLIIY
jgi:hypothetical protein